MSTPKINRQFVLKSRPVGMPTVADFDLVEKPIPDLKDGEVLVRALYLSVDPYMRGRISGMKSYAAPTEIGGLMVGSGVAEVVESKNPSFTAGDIVDIYMGWQEYAISDGKRMRKLDPKIAPVSTALGVLGMPGMTAYFGLLDVCDPKPGETVLVSGAAGAVGTLVGPDRQDQGLLYGGDRRRRRQGRLHPEGMRLRRGVQLQDDFGLRREVSRTLPQRDRRVFRQRRRRDYGRRFHAI